MFLDACAGKGEDQIYSPSVRIVEGLYLCLYAPCSAEHRYEGALAVSRDGLNFTRVKNGSRTLPVGPAGAWDSGIARFDWPVSDGQIARLYYGGSAYHHGTEPYTPPTHIGLATMRPHGWTYYSPAGDGPAELLTIPIDAPASVRKRLTVNLWGKRLRVEVLDAATGRPIAGFARTDCRPADGDGLAVTVAWESGTSLPAGKPIRLRFLLEKGVRLYSFGFVDAG